MTDTDGAVLRVFGWCSAPTNARPHHNLCRHEFTSQVGVLHRCSCPCHQKEDN